MFVFYTCDCHIISLPLQVREDSEILINASNFNDISALTGDVDVSSVGRVLFRLSNDSYLLGQVGDNISDAFQTDFLPTSVAVATWDRVPEDGGDPTVVSF